jgi:cyclohexyl-isocyanide hydratase
MILLDLTGPQTVFFLSMADVHLLWKERAYVMTDVGVPLMPTTTFADFRLERDHFRLKHIRHA